MIKTALFHCVVLTAQLLRWRSGWDGSLERHPNRILIGFGFVGLKANL